MLNLESRMEILGITVFQDADNAKQFYYLPGNPHISYENGEPLFDLFAYRKGGAAENLLSGGFLNMTVDLGIGGLKDRIEQQLTDRFGDGVTLPLFPSKRAACASSPWARTAARLRAQPATPPQAVRRWWHAARASSKTSWARASPQWTATTALFSPFRFRRTARLSSSA